MNDQNFTGTALRRFTETIPACEVRESQHKRSGNGYKQFGTALVVGLTIMIANARDTPADPPRSPWFFNAEEIGAAYQYQENYGLRIRHPLPAEACIDGKAEFVATYRQAKVQVQCQFINEVTRHLREMLALGAARYLFPLDADHAHMGVPTEIWAKKYSKLDPSQVINGLLHKPALVALYHTAEHLDPVEARSKESEASVRAWKEKRNVLGFFDGRPSQILPPHPEGFGVGMPEGYVTYGGFNFLANHRAGLMLFNGDKVIPFDVSLENGEEIDANAFFGRNVIRAVHR
jgi:hypothetical protein